MKVKHLTAVLFATFVDVHQSLSLSGNRIERKSVLNAKKEGIHGRRSILNNLVACNILAVTGFTRPAQAQVSLKEIIFIVLAFYLET